MDFTELRATIIAEHPELEGAADDWTVVKALRSYAAAHVDYVINVDSPFYRDQGGQPVEDRFTTFAADGGGVVCGGAADALTELARAFGYSAWNLGIGDTRDGGFTHVQTLIEIEADGASVLTLHDPSTNLSYSDLAGDPLDYYALLTALAEGDASGIGTVEDRADADNLVAAAETTDIAALAESSWTVDPADYTVAPSADGWVVRSPRTAARFAEVISPWYVPFLAENGLPEDAVWLEMFPNGIYGSNGDAMLTQAQAILAAGASAVIGFEAAEGFALGDADGTVNQRYFEAGYPVQTWYYGGTTVVAAGDGQALQVAYVDGVGGDEEGIFELQGFTTGAVSARVQAADDSDVHVVVRGSDYSVLYDEMVASGSVFAWSDPDTRIWRLVVETDGGAVLVDDVAYGRAAATRGPEDTGGADSGPPEDSSPTVDSGAAQDTGPAGDSAPARDTGPAADADPTPGCGCGTSAGPSGWALIAAVVGFASVRRRSRSA